MSAPVRFRAVAVAGWTLFRGVTAGVLPGVEVFTLGKAEAAPAPIAATQFPPITPIQQEAPPAEPYAFGPPQYYPAYYPPQPGYPAYGGYALPYQ